MALERHIRVTCGVNARLYIHLYIYIRVNIKCCELCFWSTEIELNNNKHLELRDRRFRSRIKYSEKKGRRRGLSDEICVKYGSICVYTYILYMSCIPENVKRIIDCMFHVMT